MKRPADNPDSAEICIPVTDIICFQEMLNICEKMGLTGRELAFGAFIRYQMIKLSKKGVEKWVDDYGKKMGWTDEESN